MGAARKKYTPEYKAEAVGLVVNSGRPVAEIARDLGIHEATLGNWVNLAKKNGTIVEKPVTADERARSPTRSIRWAVRAGPSAASAAGQLPAAAAPVLPAAEELARMVTLVP